MMRRHFPNRQVRFAGYQPSPRPQYHHQEWHANDWEWGWDASWQESGLAWWGHHDHMQGSWGWHQSSWDSSFFSNRRPPPRGTIAYDYHCRAVTWEACEAW